MRPLLLIGGGGHAHACIDVVEADGRFWISGIVDSKLERGVQILGYSVLGSDDDLSSFLTHCPNALVAIGQIESAAPRRRVFEMLRNLGFTMPTIVSSRAHVSRHAHIGDGSVVMHGAIVNAGARVGENCIINSRALVEHDAVIDDHCHISTGAVVNGGARVGAASFVGSGAVLRQGVVVGEDCLIGMQQGVRHDCMAGTRLPEKTTR